MEISSLATTSLKVIYGSALGGFGLSAGRDAYKNIRGIITWVIILAIGVGSFVLPLMAGKKITQWHPMSKSRYFFRIFLVWSILAAIGFVLMWGVSFVITTLGLRLNDVIIDFKGDEFHGMVKTVAVVLWTIVLLIGALAGCTERKKRRAAYAVAMENQEFLDTHGIRDIDGKNVTHVDGDGNRLKMEHVGKDVVEFKVQGNRGQRAFIEIGPDGRFLKYSGAIAG